MGGRRAGVDDLTPEEAERVTSAEILELLESIEAAVQVVKLYVADALLDAEKDRNVGGD